MPTQCYRPRSTAQPRPDAGGGAVHLSRRAAPARIPGEPFGGGCKSLPRRYASFWTLALALALALCPLGLAADSIIEQHFVISPTAPAWERMIAVKQHHLDSGSSLVQVDMRVTATITGTLDVQNPDTKNAQSISVTYSTTVSLKRPDRTLLTQLIPTYASSQELPAGGSTTLANVSGTGTASMTTAAPADLRLFTGSGSVNLRLDALKEAVEALGTGGKLPTAYSLSTPLVSAQVWVTFHTVTNAIFDVYRCTIQTLENTTIADTCRASSMREARTAFESRHPGTRLVTTLYVPDALKAGYMPYLGGLRTPDKENIEDTCWALSSDDASEILVERHRGAVINRLGLYPANRDLLTWVASVQRARGTEYVKAFDAKEALAVLVERYPRNWIARIAQDSNDNKYRLYEAVLDPKPFVERVEARSVAAATQAAFLKFPQHRVLDTRFSQAGDSVEPYEGVVSLEKGTATDTCPAASPGEARRILADRHGGAKVANLRPRGRDPLYALYQGAISIPGAGNLVDVACAKNALEARAILVPVYSTGNVGGVTLVTDAEKISKFRGRISTADGRNVIDTCWAASSAAARKVFLARFPEGGVRSISAFGSNRPDVYEVTLKGTYRKDGCEARDKGEAARILLLRFPDYNVVSVDELDVIPEEAVYRAQINTREGETIADTVQAKTSSAARILLLASHPDSHLTSLYRATDGRVKETFMAQIDLGPAQDTVQADSSAEATRILLGRYPGGGITALQVTTGLNNPPSRKGF